MFDAGGCADGRGQQAADTAIPARPPDRALVIDQGAFDAGRALRQRERFQPGQRLSIEWLAKARHASPGEGDTAIVRSDQTVARSGPCYGGKGTLTGLETQDLSVGGRPDRAVLRRDHAAKLAGDNPAVGGNPVPPRTVEARKVPGAAPEGRPNRPIGTAYQTVDRVIGRTEAG